jgi:hypothetical protein
MINKKLKEMSVNSGFICITSHKITLQGGKPLESLFYDGLHMKKAGVFKFRQYLCQRLSEFGTKPNIPVSGSNHYLRRPQWSKF